MRQQTTYFGSLCVCFLFHHRLCSLPVLQRMKYYLVSSSLFLLQGKTTTTTTSKEKEEENINCKRNPTTINKKKLVFCSFFSQTKNLIPILFAWSLLLGCYFFVVFLILPLRVVFLIFLSFCTS